MLKVRAQGIASTRADVIGHSMGGVLARLYAQSFGGIAYRRNDNFNAGDIHKLITVNAPLKGCPLATFLMGSEDFRLAFEKLGKNCENGAVANLDALLDDPDVEPIVQSNIQSTDVNCHAIIGTGGATVYSSPLMTSFSDERNLALVMKHFHIGNVFSGAHDLIVEQGSQEGNIEHTTVFPYLDAANPGLHGTVLKEARVKLAVLGLLDTNVLWPLAFESSIPARGLGGAIPEPPNNPSVSGMSVISPAPGAVYSSGSQIPIVVTPINGFQPERILVISRHDVQEIDPAVLTTTLDIPANAVGPMSLYVSAFDADSNHAQTDDVVVQIVPPATMTGLSIAPGAFELDRLGPTQSLVVTGHYDDSIDRDLTLGVLGTTYEVKNAPVATVSADGLVQSLDFGETAITAYHGEFKATTVLNVVGLPCPADIVEDNTVDVSDLSEVVLYWGPCYACAADIDGSGMVDIVDYSTVLLNWGPCPSP